MIVGPAVSNLETGVVQVRMWWNIGLPPQATVDKIVQLLAQQASRDTMQVVRLKPRFVDIMLHEVARRCVSHLHLYA